MRERDPVHGDVGLEREPGRGLDAPAVAPLVPRSPEESPELIGHPARDRALRSELIAHPHVLEIVPAHRNHEVGIDLERLGEELVVALVVRAPLVTVLELHSKRHLRLPALQPARGVGHVLDARFEAHLPDPAALLRPSAEAQLRERLPKVLAPEKSDLRVEIQVHERVADAGPVQVRVVVEDAAIALVLPVEPIGPASRVVAADHERVRESKAPIDPVHLVRAGAHDRLGPVGEEGSDLALSEDVPLDPEDGETRGVETRRLELLGFDVEDPEGIGPDLPRHPGARADRDDSRVGNPDAAAEEQDRGVVRPALIVEVAAEAGVSESEVPLPLQEKLSLLRILNVEARQVHLDLVVLDLGEVGVHGDVRDEAPGDPVLDVDTRLGSEIVRDHGLEIPIGAERRDRVGLHLEVSRRGGLDSDERRRRGCLYQPAEIVGRGHARQVGYLVLPLDDAAEVDSPNLLPPGPEPERLEGDRDLHHTSTWYTADAQSRID